MTSGRRASTVRADGARGRATRARSGAVRELEDATGRPRADQTLRHAALDEVARPLRGVPVAAAPFRKHDERVAPFARLTLSRVMG